MGKNLIVCGTKGGTGKSIVASMILSLIFNNCKIFEIDDNNKTRYKNSKIEIVNLNLKKIDEAILEAEISDYINIIDCGGGNDTKEILQTFADNFVEVKTFFIPILSDYEQIYNLENTIKLIRKYYKKEDIVILLNRAINLDKQDLLEQFVFLFGNEELNIKNKMKELQEKYNIKAALPIKDTFLISYCKNFLQQTLLDVEEKANEIGDLQRYKIEQLKILKEKIKNKEELKKEYKKVLSFVSLVNKVKKYNNNIKEIFEPINLTV